MNPENIAKLITEDNKLRREVDQLIRKGETGAALAKAVDAAEKGETLEPSVKDKLKKATKKVMGASKDVVKKMLEGIEKFSGDELIELENWAKQAISSGSRYFGFDGDLFYLSDTPGPHAGEGDEGVLKWHPVRSSDDVMRMAKVVALPEVDPNLCQSCQGRGDISGDWCSACDGKGYTYTDTHFEDKQVKKLNEEMHDKDTFEKHHCLMYDMHCQACGYCGRNENWVDCPTQTEGHSGCPKCGYCYHDSVEETCNAPAPKQANDPRVNQKCGTCGEWWPCTCLNMNEY